MASASTAAVCPGVTGISSQYVGGNRGGYAVRCGSQQVNPYGESGVIRGGSAGIYRAAPQVRTVSAAPEIKVPKGYRAAWEDDRLNPNRGKQTLEGRFRPR